MRDIGCARFIVWSAPDVLRVTMEIVKL